MLMGGMGLESLPSHPHVWSSLAVLGIADQSGIMPGHIQCVQLIIWT